jgi:hypothetical protein
MAAPTNAALVKKVLANSEPSTHDPQQIWALHPKRLASPSRHLSDPRKRDITECDSWAEFALYSAARDKHSWTMTNAEGCQAARGGAC